MRCMSCGAELHVLRVEHDDALSLAGCERQTLQCSACHDVETRTVFRESSASPTVAPVPHHSAPPTSASPAPENDLDDGEELLRRAIEMVRGPAPGAQPTGGVTEAEPVVPAGSAAASEADPELDEGQAMLHRAIEMVRGATRGGRTHPATGIVPPADLPAHRSAPGRAA